MNVQIFNNPQFGEIRTAGTPENPLFCLADLCRVLELQTGATKNRLDQRGISLINTPTKNQFGCDVMQEMVYVSEKNLYKVILRSDKPQAEPFQDWVFGDVLPSIRKHGMYATPQTIDSILANPDNAIRILTAYKEEKEERQRLELLSKHQEEVIREQTPKVVFANAVSGSTSSILIGELAKILRQNGINIGEKRLFQWLRDNGYLGKSGERYNVPNQRYIEMGLFTLKTNTFSINGEMKTKNTTKVTSKGVMYFVNKFLSMVDGDNLLNAI